MIQEMAVEREHHQRLVKEHGRLQQRMENLLEERNAKSMLDFPLYSDSRCAEQVLSGNYCTNLCSRNSRHCEQVAVKKSHDTRHAEQPTTESYFGNANNSFSNHSRELAVAQRYDCVGNETNSWPVSLRYQNNGIRGFLGRVLNFLAGSRMFDWLMFLLSPSTTRLPFKFKMDCGMHFRFSSG